MAFPDRVNIDVVDHEELAFDLQFELEYSETLRRYRLKNLAIHARSEDVEVTMRNVNKIALQDFVAQGLSRLSVYEIQKASYTKHVALDYMPIDGTGYEPLDLMLYVPYRVAEVLNGKPTQHMANMNETGYATAADQLGRSRKRGDFQKFDDLTADREALTKIARPYKGEPIIHGNS